MAQTKQQQRLPFPVLRNESEETDKIFSFVDYGTIHPYIQPAIIHMYREDHNLEAKYAGVKYIQFVGVNVATTYRDLYNAQKNGVNIGGGEMVEIEEMKFLDTKTGILFVMNNSIDPGLKSDVFVYVKKGEPVTMRIDGEELSVCVTREEIKEQYFCKVKNITINEIAEIVDTAREESRIVTRDVYVDAFLDGEYDNMETFVKGTMNFVFKSRSDILPYLEGVIMLAGNNQRTVFPIPELFPKIVVFDTGKPDSPAFCYNFEDDQTKKPKWYLVCSSLFMANAGMESVIKIDFQ